LLGTESEPGIIDFFLDPDVRNDWIEQFEQYVTRTVAEKLSDSIAIAVQFSQSDACVMTKKVSSAIDYINSFLMGAITSLVDNHLAIVTGPSNFIRELQGEEPIKGDIFLNK